MEWPPGLVLVVVAAWLALPFLHAGSPAEDAIPFVVAGQLVGGSDDDAGALYVDEGDDLYDLEPAFRARACRFYDDAAACDDQAVAFIASPAALPLVAPLGWLDGDAAVLVFRLLGAAAMAVGFLLLLAWCGPVDERVAVVAAVLFTFEVNHQVTLGQTSPLLFLLAATALSRVRGVGGELALGAGVATAVALKGFPVVLLVALVVARRWRLVASAGAWLLALGAAALAIAPTSTWGEFVESARGVERASVDNPFNGSIGAVVGSRPVGLVIGAVAVVAVVAVLRRATDDERWSAALPVGLLVVPQVWGHYLATATAAAVGVAPRARTLVVAVALLVPAAVLAGADHDAPPYQLAYLAGSLAFVGWAVARRPGRARARNERGEGCG